LRTFVDFEVKQVWPGVVTGYIEVVFRARHIGEIERAERWELALDGAIEALARVKNAFTAKFQTPRSAH